MATSLDNEALTRLLIGAITTQGYILKTLCKKLKDREGVELLGHMLVELRELGDIANPNPHLIHMAPRLMLEGMSGEKTSDELLEMVQGAN